MTGRPALVIVGPAEHGVVIVARQLAADLAADDGSGANGPAGPRVVMAPTLDHLLATDPATALESAAVAHVHFTDQLFGSTCALAADGYVAFAAWAARAGAVTSVTLHDLPAPDDDPARYARRRAAYARIVGATAGPVIVSSRHESALLTAALGACDVAASDLSGGIAAPAVIPLAIDPPGPTGPRPRPDGDVAVLGFIYPGKGHALALDAMTGLAAGGGPAPPGLVALGRTADGHDGLTAQLRRTATGRGIRFTVAGYLPGPELTRRMRRATVPLAAHDRISASGSIGTWLTAGRRPLVPDGPYTRELAERCPGAVTLYEPTVAGLRQALARAVQDQESTWLDDVALTPTRPDVAARYRGVLARAATVGRAPGPSGG